MTIAQYVVALAVVAVGAIAQGSVGFGFGMIAAPVLALIDESLVPGVVLLLALLTAITVAWQERGALDWRGIKWALVGRVFGTLAGAYAVSRLSHDALAIALGVIVLIAVALSVWGLHVRIERGTLVGAGALSGFMGTLTSVGGPPMALVYQREQAAKLRATLAGFFLFGATFSLLTLAASGEVGTDQLKYGALLVPGMVAGLVASRYLASHLDKGWSRWAVLAMSAVASVVLIAEAIT